MKETEAALEETVVEDPAQEAVAERNRTKSVPVSQAEDLPSDFNGERLAG